MACFPRLARVVTWLEELAGRQLDIEERAAARAGGAAAAFSRREGLPLSTLGELERNPAARAALPQHLDPDAATRWALYTCWKHISSNSLHAVLAGPCLDACKQLLRETGRGVQERSGSSLSKVPKPMWETWLKEKLANI